MQQEIKSAKLPPIRDLFEESFNIFSKCVFRLFIFSIFATVAYTALFILAFILGGSSLLPFILEKGAKLSLENLNFGIIALAIFVFALGSIIISTVWQVGLILIVDNPDRQVSYKDLIKKGFSFILPLFLTGLISFFLVVGAFFVFILPSILLLILFTFSQQEIVLGNKKYFSALKGSASIVSSNFGAIFVRIIIIWIMYLLTSVVSGSGTIAASILGIILNIILGWFSLVYMITLYKQAKAAAKENVTTWWMWVVAIIGWIIATLLFTLIGISLIYGAKSGKLDTIFNKSADTTSNSKIKPSPADDLIKAGNIKLSTANQLSTKQGLTDEDIAQIRGLINGALNDFSAATEKDPENYLAWFYRGVAYRNLIGVTSNTNTSGANAFAIESFKKAIELNPKDFNSYSELGGLYFQIKDYDNAILNFQQVVKLQPESANGYYNLGVAYKMVGAKTEARKALQKALDLLPKDDPTRYKADAELQGL